MAAAWQGPRKVQCDTSLEFRGMNIPFFTLPTIQTEEEQMWQEKQGKKQNKTKRSL